MQTVWTARQLAVIDKPKRAFAGAALVNRRAPHSGYNIPNSCSIYSKGVRMPRKLLCAFLLVGAVVFAQSITSSLIGTVHDNTGAVVPNATVTAVELATNARSETHTDASGNYVLLQLKPGSYTVEISAPGFKKYVRSGVVLELQQQARLDASLEVGQLSEAVTVTADASTLETTVSTVGDVVNNRAILNLPLNTRNIYSLIYLTPGVAGGIGNDYNSLSYSVNGARGSSMETMVDGATGGFPTVNGYFGIGVFPSVDAIGEFKMMDSNYSAEFGRSLGNVVNVIYKSGTNSFHGSAYEFLRNSALDANTFFSNARGVALPSFRRHQFGGVINGPIIKDKTFFLFSLEDLRQNAFQSVTTTVPTLLQRQGDFSQTFAANGQQIRIFDPFTTRPNPSGGYIRDAFAGNVIPLDRINPVSANLVKYFPLPNTAGNPVTNANNYYNTGGHINDINSWDVRIDHNLTSTQRIFGRYSDRFSNDVPASLFPKDIGVAEGVINQKNYMRNAVIDYTNTLSPTTILSARLGFARALYLYINGGLGFNVSSLGLPKELDTAGYLPMFPMVSTGATSRLAIRTIAATPS
jgi:hypothetical protein